MISTVKFPDLVRSRPIVLNGARSQDRGSRLVRGLLKECIKIERNRDIPGPSALLTGQVETICLGLSEMTWN